MTSPDKPGETPPGDKTPSTSSRACRVCRAAFSGETFIAREMMLGTRDQFEYWECGDCGCVQIVEVPANLDDYYPRYYFSLKPYRRPIRTLMRKAVDRRRVCDAFGDPNWLGRIGNRVLKPLDYVDWCLFAQIGTETRVLDVGCGAGKLPLRMKLGGFKECVGVDPHIHADIDYAAGVHIYRKEIAELAAERPESFEVVMFHHSLEHVPDPHAALRAARQLLTPGGKLLIRIPVTGSYAWRRYGENWVQLDPPRHLWLPTVESMHRLAAENGFSLARARFDSTPMQFLGSELYQRNIPMNAPRKQKDIFSASALRRFKDATRHLNEDSDGDQALFVLLRA
jgi:SAM-dependent methyltransferase